MKLSEFGSVSQRPQLINKKTSAGDTPVMSLNRDELEFTFNFIESNCVQFLSMGERLKENNLWEISERSEYLQWNFWHLQWALAWNVREISPCTTGQLEQDSFLWKARCQPQKLLSSAGTARFPMELLDTLMMTNRTITPKHSPGVLSRWQIQHTWVKGLTSGYPP